MNKNQFILTMEINIAFFSTVCDFLSLSCRVKTNSLFNAEHREERLKAKQYKFQPKRFFACELSC